MKTIFFSLAILLVQLNGLYSQSSISFATIGQQVWMTENLSVDKFRNGEIIPEAKSDLDWKTYCDKKLPCWCFYNNDPNNASNYGKLYNWYAVNDPRGIAPDGFHVPTLEEVETLFSIVGYEGGKNLKSSSSWSDYEFEDLDYYYCTNCKNWNDEYRRKVPCHVCKDERIIVKNLGTKIEHGNGTNSFGFNAKPGGRRGSLYDSRRSGFQGGPSAEFAGKGELGYFWTSSNDDTYNAHFWVLYNHKNQTNAQDGSKSCGFSVRCIEGASQQVAPVDQVRTKPEFDLDEWAKLNHMSVQPQKPKVDCTEWTVDNLFEENFKPEFKEQAAKDFVLWYIKLQPAFVRKYSEICGFTSDGVFVMGEVHKNGLVRLMSTTIRSAQPGDTLFNVWIEEYKKTNPDFFIDAKVKSSHKVTIKID